MLTSHASSSAVQLKGLSGSRYSLEGQRQPCVARPRTTKIDKDADDSGCEMARRMAGVGQWR